VLSQDEDSFSCSLALRQSHRFVLASVECTSVAEVGTPEAEIVQEEVQLEGSDCSPVAEDRSLAAEDSSLAAEDSSLAAEDSSLAAEDSSLAAEDSSLAAEDSTPEVVQEAQLNEQPQKAAVDELLQRAWHCPQYHAQ